MITGVTNALPVSQDVDAPTWQQESTGPSEALSAAGAMGVVENI